MYCKLIWTVNTTNKAENDTVHYEKKKFLNREYENNELRSSIGSNLWLTGWSVGKKWLVEYRNSRFAVALELRIRQLYSEKDNLALSSDKLLDKNHETIRWTRVEFIRRCNAIK